MIFADKISGIQLVTFFNTKTSRYSTKFTIDTPNLVVYFVVTFVSFVLKNEMADEWHADFL